MAVIPEAAGAGAAAAGAGAGAATGATGAGEWVRGLERQWERPKRAVVGRGVWTGQIGEKNGCMDGSNRGEKTDVYCIVGSNRGEKKRIF